MHAMRIRVWNRWKNLWTNPHQARTGAASSAKGRRRAMVEHLEPRYALTAPTAVHDLITVEKNTPYSNAAPGIVANDIDPENGPLTVIEIAINGDRKSTRLNSSHSQISYAVFCLKKKKTFELS